MIDLLVEGGGKITTTEDHRFWNATHRQWQQAQDLDQGVQLLAANGDTVAFDRLDWTSIRTAVAYNLTINNLHTYFVLIGGKSALVHNDACGLGHSGIHQFPGVPPGKSQFFDDVDLGRLSDTTGVSGTVQRNSNTRYVMRSQGEVGVDRTTGLPTNIYTVIRKPDGSVLTMFPGTSPKS